MANNENLIPIPGRLHSVATEGHVSGADEIYDDTQQKDQETINSELIAAVGTGGSVDSRIAAAVNVEKTRAEGAESTLTTNLGNEVTRATNAEEALDGRVDTLEEAVGTGGSVDSRISAAVAVETTRAQEAEADRYTKSETYNKTELNNMITTPNQEYVSVTATAQTTAVTDVLPATGAADTTYRIGNWDGTQYNDSVFSEYAWNGSAYIKLSTKSQVGEVYDISANHADTKYADLAAALNGGANIPQSLQKGGMSVKFVQSSDNKYMQFRCMAQDFTTDITQWQGVDDKPTAGSDNLVKSGGVVNGINNTFKRNGFIQPISFTQNDFNFLFYDVSNLSKVFICVSGNINGVYSIFRANSMPYSSPEYIKKDINTTFYEEVKTDGYNYIGIWIDNISDYAIKVGTEARDYEITEIKKTLINILSLSIFEYTQSDNKFKYANVSWWDNITLTLTNTGGGQYSIFLSNSVNPHSNIEYVERLVTGDRTEQISTNGYTYVVVWVENITDSILSIVTEESKKGKNIKFASLGDSITSNQVTNTALAIKDILGVSYLKETAGDGSPSDAGNVTTEFGNLAVGYATMTDLWIDGANKTEPHLLKSQNLNGQLVASAYNTLSNQVLRLLQHTTPLNQQISWTHPLTGVAYNIDTSVGVGKGYTNDKPDIIYIAIGTNDTIPSKYVDDCETVFAQSYAELKRDTFASALRWAVETLRINYPYAMIFVATPLHRKAGTDGGYPYGGEIQKTKQLLIKKICEWLGIFVIDSYAECGIGEDTVLGGWLTEGGVGNGGTHPNEIGRLISAKYIAGQIKSASGDLF